MNFEVTFSSKPGVVAAASFDTSYVGTDRIDAIRQKCGCDLPLDRITGDVRHTFSNPLVEISEEIARKSGLFSQCRFLKVIVPSEYLNRFYRDEVVIDKDNETGEVKRAYIQQKLNTDDLLQHWEELGFPVIIDEVPLTA